MNLGVGISLSGSVLAQSLRERQTQNYLQHSNGFSTSPWALYQASIAQNVTDPFGNANNAWTLTATAVADALVYQPQGALASSATISFFGKGGTDNWMYIRLLGADGGITDFYFNAATGANGSTVVESGSPGWGQIANAPVSLGNGWWRFSITLRNVGTNNPEYIYFGVADANGSTAVTVGKTALIFGADANGLPFLDAYNPTA